MNKIFISYHTTDDLRISEGVNLGQAHYSYKIVKDRFVKVIQELGIEVIVLKMPHIYKHPIALKELFDKYEIKGKPIHLIIKPPEEAKYLKGAYNIIAFAWEFSKPVDFDQDGLTVKNQLFMLQKMDEIWVHCSYTKEILIKAGLQENKIFVIATFIPEVNVTSKKTIESIFEKMNYVNLDSHIRSIQREEKEIITTKVIHDDYFSKLDKILIKLGRYKLLMEFYFPRTRLFRLWIFKFIYQITKYTNSIFRLIKRLTVFPIELIIDNQRVDSFADESHTAEIVFKVKNISKDIITISQKNSLSFKIKIKNIEDKTIKIQYGIHFKENLILLPQHTYDLSVLLDYDMNLKNGHYDLEIESSMDDIRYKMAGQVQLNVTRNTHNLTNYKHYYLSIFNPNDERKNIEDMITSFIYFNQSHQDAVLVLKLVIDNKLSTIENTIDNIIEFLKQYNVQNYKYNIILLSDKIPQEDFGSFIELMDFYYCTSKGEGQCLPILEAMSMGLVPISVNNTAMRDYITDENACVIKSTQRIWGSLHNKQAGHLAMTYNIDWKDAVEALEKSYNLTQEEYDKKSKLNIEIVHSNYSLSTAENLIQNRFTQINI